MMVEDNLDTNPGTFLTASFGSYARAHRGKICRHGIRRIRPAIATYDYRFPLQFWPFPFFNRGIKRIHVDVYYFAHSPWDIFD
jgi:hypothetical protein